MQALSFINQKGGVGKTTTALNIGAFFAASGKRTLLIDMDAQTNLSSTFGKQGNIPGNIYDFLIEDAEPTIEKVAPDLYLLPGSSRMSLFDKNIIEKNQLMPALQLKDRLAEYKLEDSFDYVIFDSPPKLDFITINVLSFINWVFIPVMSDQYSIDGASATMRSFEQVRKATNKDLNIGGLFMVRYDQRTILYRAYKDQLTEVYKSLVLENNTRENVALRESIARGTDVFTYDSMSNGAKDYAALGNEMLFVMREEKINWNPSAPTKPEMATVK